MIAPRFISCLPHTSAVVLAGLVLGLTARPAGATFFTLMDGNSTIEVDTSAQAVLYDWEVDGVHHLNEISNWYRVGPGGRERSVHMLRIISETLQDLDFDGNDETLAVVYRDLGGRFDLQIDYAVRGFATGSGTSGLDEDVWITNTRQDQQDLEFHYFEYYDLDLYNSPLDDTVEVVSPHAIEQTDPLTFTTWGFDSNNRYELDTVGNTLGHLTDLGPSTLNSVWPAGAGPLGPDNVTFAVQFDFEGTFPGAPPPPLPVIPWGTSAHINKVGHLQQIPEPTGAALVVFAVAACRLRRRLG